MDKYKLVEELAESQQRSALFDHHAVLNPQDARRPRPSELRVVSGDDQRAALGDQTAQQAT